MTIDSSVLLSAAHAAAGAQQYPASALYVVATPIGNLADISLRAVHVLALVDSLACEDTRVSRQLMRYLGLRKPLLALHQHNEHEASRLALERLARGERLALVSDAGTPSLSDPGAVLVAAAQSAGFRTIPIPGASSALAALSVAGDARSASFEFAGFLSARGGERAKHLERIVASRATQVLFEAPHRIEELAGSLANACPTRRLTVCRELTKQFETVATMDAGALPAWLAADKNRGRGEFVLVLHAQTGEASSSEGAAQTERMLRTLLRELPLKQAVSLASELCGAPRNALYQQALALRGSAQD